MSNNLTRNSVVGTNQTRIECRNNDLGRHIYVQTKDKTGHQLTQSDLFEESLCGTDSRRAIKGDNIASTGGNASNFVSEKSENVVGSQYTLCGSAWMLKMHPGEDVDRTMTEWVAMRSQPETVVDTDLLSLPDDLLSPAPGLTKCIVQPSASELANKGGSSGGGSAGSELANLTSKISSMASAFSAETAKEMLKLQTNHTKNVIKNNIEVKKKMFDKMPTVSKEEFKENMGKALCPGDGEFSFENIFKGVGNVIQLLSNPMALIAMCFSPSTDPEKAPQKQRYDKNSAQEMAVKKQKEITDAERRMS